MRALTPANSLPRAANRDIFQLRFVGLSVLNPFGSFLMFKRLIAVCLPLVAAPAMAVTSSYDASGNVLPAAPFTRFDASNLGSTSPVLPLPGFPANPYFGTGFTPTSPAQSVTGGIYDSGLTDSSKYTFWYNNSLTLDENQTIELDARLKVVSSTTATNRAGVALAMTSNQNNYTELYFTPTQIFLNGAGRVTTGSFAVDTSVFHDYELKVQGTNVSVLVDGVTEITGSSFDASTVSAPTLANWATLGDITSDAGGEYQIQNFSVSVVPEPCTIGVVIAGGMLLTRRLRGRWVRSRRWGLRPSYLCRLSPFLLAIWRGLRRCFCTWGSRCIPGNSRVCLCG